EECDKCMVRSCPGYCPEEVTSPTLDQVQGIGTVDPLDPFQEGLEEPILVEFHPSQNVIRVQDKRRRGYGRRVSVHLRRRGLRRACLIREAVEPATDRPLADVSGDKTA